MVRRSGPAPVGGPGDTSSELARQWPDPLPQRGIGAEKAIDALLPAVAAGAVDPSHPRCVAHLHAPPFALAVASDLAAGVFNPSLDSWDQAGASVDVETRLCRSIAELVHSDEPDPDALVTTGATESNLVAMLVARERSKSMSEGAMPVVFCAESAHHSAQRAAWILELERPRIIPTVEGRMDTLALDAALAAESRPCLVIATAGTTDRGRLDPLESVASLCRKHGARFHVDAAYGGCALFSDHHAHALAGVETADSVAFDFHKFGGQPLAAGMVTFARSEDTALLSVSADYLNADDDSEAGLPDLLGRSLRTSRRPDALKLAVTLLALGREGLGATVDRCCEIARSAAHLIDADPELTLMEAPELSTVLFRPALADRAGEPAGSHITAEIRRSLLANGDAVLGRASLPDQEHTPKVWLKLTLLNPHLTTLELEDLLSLVKSATHRPSAAAVT
ncbi:pyridoxal phosphate-dependent decarboxylase family protein [Nocardiopsis salina]|uniref:pyridoxal phosphate-dependent decarboxylase family protein n=1 Tax=Nocardiopsis salina TaxID=245836 RepID=UPI001378D888|nr:aminotransferase class V-fold PLP-dependent enzyme [Nocardiopsis salina]